MLFNPLQIAGSGAGEADGYPGFHSFVAAVHGVGEVTVFCIGEQLVEEMRGVHFCFAKRGKINVIFLQFRQDVVFLFRC